GIPDATRDIDLEQTAFPVMPWVLTSSKVSPYAGQLNMLFAMGSDAYRLASVMTGGQQNRSFAMPGSMGELSAEGSGEIAYQPLWAKFENGVAETNSELLPISDSILIPGRIDQEERLNRPNGEKRYDESNWDPRQSRRKSGS
ncbi:MAG: hypothetical protein HKN85_11795, partial [Gammaproteobacteria bacterium]|nr:hypothetical protein [Gammaproteobacteria bacterium]